MAPHPGRRRRERQTYAWDATGKYTSAADTRTSTFASPGSGGVDAMAFAPNGDRLAVGDANGNAYPVEHDHRKEHGRLRRPRREHRRGRSGVRAGRRHADHRKRQRQRLPVTHPEVRASESKKPAGHLDLADSAVRLGKDDQVSVGVTQPDLAVPGVGVGVRVGPDPHFGTAAVVHGGVEGVGRGRMEADVRVVMASSSRDGGGGGLEESERCSAPVRGLLLSHWRGCTSISGFGWRGGSDVC
jgi:hypothetical protein